MTVTQRLIIERLQKERENPPFRVGDTIDIYSRANPLLKETFKIVELRFAKNIHTGQPQSLTSLTLKKNGHPSKTILYEPAYFNYQVNPCS